MLLYTREQCQQLDLKFDQIQLVQSAADAAVQRLKEWFTSNETPFEFFVGPGNNGADGLAVACKLFENGWSKVQINFVLSSNGRKDSSAHTTAWDHFFQQTVHIGIRHSDSTWVNRKDLFSQNAILVDCIFGTGCREKSSPELNQLMVWMNSLPNIKVAIDIPTGLDANTGEVFSFGCLRANKTITFAGYKPGMLIESGPEMCGEIFVDPLLWSKEDRIRIANTHRALGAKTCRLLLPELPSLAHKKSIPEIHILAGSVKYPGAAILAARGALKSGGRTVHLHTDAQFPKDWFSHPEILLNKLPQKKNSLRSFINELPNEAVVLIGPGLGINVQTEIMIKALIEKRHPLVIVDADALTVCAKIKTKGFLDSWIFTPHFGELKRFQSSAKSRIERTRELASARGGIWISKGFRTVICKNQKSYTILSGNAALAKAGSGDVLAGMIAGFLSQNQNPIQASALGVFVHGACANFWENQGKDRATLEPSEILNLAPEVIKKLRE